MQKRGKPTQYQHEHASGLGRGIQRVNEDGATARKADIQFLAVLRSDRACVMQVSSK